MRIKAIYVRFYKSFNFDYERKYARSSEPDPWELLDGAWYPYVRLEIDPSITTIVGANESGKSHLLDAIEKLITGKGIDRSDFCRYSHFFSVEQGRLRSPDFGGEFEVVSESDVELAKQHMNLELSIGESFHLFRPNGDNPVIYLADEEPIKLSKKQVEALKLILPAVFRLNAHIPLPSSIALRDLASEAQHSYGSRRTRGAVFESFLGRTWKSAEELAKAAPTIFPLLAVGRSTNDNDEEYRLGRALVFEVAQIDPRAFKDLVDAIADEREGYVSGVIQKINDALARHLNFPRWWAQDREFRLMVSPREHELVFTIHDRTGTDYSFGERSNGLKYFLSYHVQLLAHQPPPNGQPEILLMDEPDAYLSSQGQQDLLRILEAFAQPEARSREDQVIYVTHSPFLINRNAAERIRVLDKGVADEGTRVVKDVARNHYEPLRSSLGVFVAETSFIGGANLFVEGLADQVMLAGISSHLRVIGASTIDTLDLNNVTIVPSGSASSIPYLVYLARGRDVTRPPCVVLLDSDAAGGDAVKALARGGARGKEVLAAEFVVQVGNWARNQARTLSLAPGVTVAELEDLISLPVAVAAARNYATKVVEVPQDEAAAITEEAISVQLDTHNGSLFDALSAAFTSCLGGTAHIEKVGFAKEVVAVMSSSRRAASKLVGIAEVEQNFRPLLAHLARLLRRAQQEEQYRRLNNRLNRTVARFLDDYPMPTTRDRGRLLVEEVEASVDNSEDGDRVKLLAEKLRREFGLDESLTEPIERFDEFRERVSALRYQERFAKQEVKVTGDNGALGASVMELDAAQIRPEEAVMKAAAETG